MSNTANSTSKRARKRTTQLIAGVVVVALTILLGLFIQTKNPKGAYIWMIGIAFGYVLQRSRFCFTAAMRDPVLTGTTDLTKAVVISLALVSVGYMALQMKAAGLKLENLGAVTALPGHVRDVGVHTVIGGFVFGVGAVIAGGCASGTLMRMGEGFVQQWIAFVFFVVGALIGMVLLPIFKASGFLYQATPVYLPQLLGGWVPAILVQFGLLFLIYVLADIYGKKKSGEL